MDVQVLDVRGVEHDIFIGTVVGGVFLAGAGAAFGAVAFDCFVCVCV